MDPWGQVATARLLLENGANVHAATNNGWTPLSLASFIANERLVGLLLDYGAHVRDLFLYRGGNPCPPIVPIGRIVFIRQNQPLGPSLSELASELRDCRARVATLLEERLGISVFLPPPTDRLNLPADYTVLSTGGLMLPGALREPLRQLRVDVVDQPFGLASLSFHDLSADDFEHNIDGVLDSLEHLGLEAFFAAVSEPEPPVIFWSTCQRYPPATE